MWGQKLFEKVSERKACGLDKFIGKVISQMQIICVQIMPTYAILARVPESPWERHSFNVKLSRGYISNTIIAIQGLL